jgi:hypothetical protein
MAMPANPEPSAAQLPDANEIRFRRMVVGGTAVSLAAAYGWLAGFVRLPDGDLSFEWRWPILVWVLIGLGSTIYFWRAIWPPQNRMATRKGIVLGTIVVVLPGLWWLIFPLRSLSGQHAREVITGLIAAAIVLSFGAWMVIRLIRSFENEDAEDLKNLEDDAPDDKDLKK